MGDGPHCGRRRGPRHSANRRLLNARGQCDDSEGIRTGSCLPTRVSGAAAAQLAGKLSGQILLPGVDGYERARRVFNAMIDRRPAVIIRCQAAEDVVEGLRFAHAYALPVAVKGGGHGVGDGSLRCRSDARSLGDEARCGRPGRACRNRGTRGDAGRSRSCNAAARPGDSNRGGVGHRAFGACTGWWIRMAQRQARSHLRQPPRRRRGDRDRGSDCRCHGREPRAALGASAGEAATSAW